MSKTPSDVSKKSGVVKYNKAAYLSFSDFNVQLAQLAPYCLYKYILMIDNMCFKMQVYVFTQVFILSATNLSDDIHNFLSLSFLFDEFQAHQSQAM